MAVNTLPRDYDLGRIIDDYERRIAFLERRLTALFGSASPESVATQGARVTSTANQSINNNTQTTVVFDAELYDNNAMHDNGVNNSRITINVPGLYTVGFNGEFTSGNDYNRVIGSILVNGATVIAREQTPGTGVAAPPRVGVTTTRLLAAGDYIEAQAFQSNTAAAARNLLLLSEYSPIMYAARIGAS